METRTLISPRGKDAQGVQLWPLVLMALLGLVGCVAQPGRPEPEFGRLSSAIDLDENTDPRIRWRPRGPLHARIRVLGERVTLGGRRPRDGAAVRWGSYVGTGSRSWARIELSGSEGRCNFQILELKTGGVIGTTERCAHRVELPQGDGRSRVPRTVYALRTGRGETEIAVLAGGMGLRLFGDRRVRVVLRAREYAVMRADSITRPRPLNRETAQRLTGWRKTFPPLGPPQDSSGSSEPPPVLYDVVRDLLRDADDRRPPARQPPSGGGGGQTPPQPAAGTDGGSRPQRGKGLERYQPP